MDVTSVVGLSSLAEILGLVEGARVLALDLETTGLSPVTDRIRLLSIGDGNRTLVLDCFENDIRRWLPALRGKILIAHNAIFDLGFLYRAGLTEIPETICTYLLVQLLTAGEGCHGFGPCGLASSVKRYLGKDLPKTLQKSDWSGPLSEEQIEYSRRDAACLIPLLGALDVELEKAGLQRAAEVELSALPAFVWLALSGVPFDLSSWRALAEEAGQRKSGIENQLNESAPRKGSPGLFGQTEFWNWDSTQQVKEVLNRLHYDVATTADVQLALLDGPTPRLLRKHRHESQLLKMYGANWTAAATIREGRVYPNWRQLGAASGRTTCERPNCQQLPREPGYRACVQAPPGRSIVKADYATLQMRIACKYARELNLLNIFERNEDPHAATARSTLGKQDVTKADRQIAKSQNFGLLFGMSAASLRLYARMTYGVEFSEAEAVQHRESFFRAYPGLARWHTETKQKRVPETRSASGRRRILPQQASDTWRLNTPVQGDEADGLKASLGLLWKRRSQCPSARPILVVHDEIVLEVDSDQIEVAGVWLRQAMLDGMSPFLDPVPVRVDVTTGDTWEKQ